MCPLYYFIWAPKSLGHLVRLMKAPCFMEIGGFLILLANAPQLNKGELE